MEKDPRSLVQHIDLEGKLRQCKGYGEMLCEGLLTLAKRTHSSGPTGSLLFVSTLLCMGHFAGLTSAGRPELGFL